MKNKTSDLKNLKHFKAIFFDMDGVIVDSMPYHFISWFEALKKYDVRVGALDVFEREGEKWQEIIKFAFNRDGKKLTAKIQNNILKERNFIFRKYFKRYIFSGIKDCLISLKKQGFLLGLVSGSSLAEAKKMLPKEILNLFDTKVTGDMVKLGKPHPQPYLLAAKNLNVKQKECMVVENAPFGIRSAKAAKMFCAAIATSLPKETLFKADIIFPTHKNLYSYFKKHIEKSI